MARWGILGHIAAVCRSTQAPSGAGRRQDADKRAPQKQPPPCRVHQVDQQDSSGTDSDEFCNQIFVLGSRSRDAYKVEVSLNSANLTMEVDTGAAVFFFNLAPFLMLSNLL